MISTNDFLYNYNNSYQRVIYMSKITHIITFTSQPDSLALLSIPMYRGDDGTTDGSNDGCLITSQIVDGVDDLNMRKHIDENIECLKSVIAVMCNGIEVTDDNIYKSIIYTICGCGKGDGISFTLDMNIAAYYGATYKGEPMWQKPRERFSSAVYNIGSKEVDDNIIDNGIITLKSRVSKFYVNANLPMYNIMLKNVDNDEICTSTFNKDATMIYNKLYTSLDDKEKIYLLNPDEAIHIPPYINCSINYKLY